MDWTPVLQWFQGLGPWGIPLGIALLVLAQRLGIKIPFLPAPVPADPATQAVTVSGFGGRRPLRDFVRNRLVAAAARQSGRPVAEVEEAVDAVLADQEQTRGGERPFLDWLLNGGFKQILEIVLMVLKVIA